MAIVLLILKIIGIVFLAILGLILLILLSVLLIPVRYQVKGNIQEEMFFGGKVSWLLSLVSFTVRFENKELSQRLRICGIPVKIGAKGEKKSSKPKKEKKRKEKKPDRVSKPLDETESGSVSSSHGGTRTGENPGKQEGQKAQEACERESGGNQTAESDSGQKPGILRKIKNIFARIADIFQRLKRMPGMIREKLANIKGIVSRVWTEVRDEANRSVVKKVFRELKYLLRHYGPRKLEVNVTFGFEDPSTTGKVLGIISATPFFYRRKMMISPDFTAEKTVFKGTFGLKGHVRGLHGVRVLFRLVRDREVRGVIKKFIH